MAVRGFTLLELLIVMVVMALMLGVTMPNLQTLYRSSVMTFEKADIRRQIGALGYQAYAQKKDILLDGGDSSTAALPIALPEGWTVNAPQPVAYRANGVCEGGVVTISNGASTETWTLIPPLCQVE